MQPTTEVALIELASPLMPFAPAAHAPSISASLRSAGRVLLVARIIPDWDQHNWGNCRRAELLRAGYDNGADPIHWGGETSSGCWRRRSSCACGGGAMGALQRAIDLHRPPVGLIHHEDRSSQYCSDDYRRLLRDNGFVASMSGRGNCYDNATVETVFKTIKSELIWRTAFRTRDQASKATGQYIEGFYNPRRRHSSLGYVSPATFEATFRAEKKEEQMALH